MTHGPNMKRPVGRRRRAQAAGLPPGVIHVGKLKCRNIISASLDSEQWELSRTSRWQRSGAGGGRRAVKGCRSGINALVNPPRTSILTFADVGVLAAEWRLG